MIVDVPALTALVEEGYLSRQKHPAYDLFIWNYTPRTQFENHWTPETMMCRGLITDPNGYVVARPFGKFLNWDQHTALLGPLPDEPFEVTEKYDGSLGIVVNYYGRLIVATRGSFASDQALHAANLLQTRYAKQFFVPGFTYLFEIIYPENRIVVDYGTMNDLVLLTIINNQTGHETNPDVRDWPFPVRKSYVGITEIGQLLARQDPNAEGFVLRFIPSNVRVKIKLDEYKRLHRILTGISARRIWELLSQNQSLDPILERVPDEFYQWVQTVAAKLRLDFYALEEQGRQLAKQVSHLSPRDRAAEIMRCPNVTVRYIAFQTLAGKFYEQGIWKAVKPAAERPFRQEEAA